MPSVQPSQRIALFVPSFRGGGAERAMILFAEGLISLGHQVDFLVAQNEGPLKNFLPQGVRLINLNTPRTSRAVPSLIRYLRRERPNAFYSTIINANIAALCARALSGVRCPLIIRESNVPNPEGIVSVARRISGFAAPLFYRFADSIISVSEDVAEALRASMPRSKNKITVLPNPVVTNRMFALADLQATHPWLTEHVSPLPKHDVMPIILGIGRLHPQKDFTTLIDAFAETRKQRNARLLILGEGPERKKLEAQITKLGLDNLVSLPGYVDNPFPYLKNARVFVLSSLYEGMPNALLQAMAFGTPVIATDCSGGAKDLLGSSTFGTLIPVGDVEAMKQAILDSLDLPRNDSAAKFVAENYSVERATNDYLQAAGI